MSDAASVTDATIQPTGWLKTSAAHVVMTAGANFLLGFFGLLSGALIARVLGPIGRGEFAAIQVWPFCFATIATLGLHDAVVYFSAKNPSLAGRFLTSAAVLALSASSLFMLVGYWLTPLLLRNHNVEVIAAARWFLWLVPLNMLILLPLYALRGCNEFLTLNVLRIALAASWVAVVGLLWLVGDATPSHLAAGYLAMLGVFFIPTSLIAKSKLRGSFLPDLTRSSALLRFGLPSLVTSVPQVLNLRLDQIVISAFLSSQALGIYAVAIAWAGISSPLLYAFGSVLLPRIASIDRSEERTQAFAQGCRLGVLAAAIVAAALCACTPWLLPLIFGVTFRAAVPVSMLLVLALSIAGLNIIIGESLRGLGNPPAVMWSELTGCSVMAGLLTILLPRFQLIGVGASCIVGYSTTLVSLVVRARNSCGCRYADLLVPTTDEITLIKSRLQPVLQAPLRRWTNRWSFQAGG